ncbi:MAG: serine/threonine protein kinase/tetratricopeptide (TPR) repeat protein [Chlamydiales bacterium]|jgi:serine/threonine protein kinase/tetratricopeptide (TPR) repeat protein
MDEPKTHKSVLDSIARVTGNAPKVLLPDEGSEHGASQLMTHGIGEQPPVPRGHGNYQIMGEVARGGMGLILKGHDTDLGRDVAFKVLAQDLSKRPEVVQRFVEEAQIGGQLQHPGIVPVYELGLMDDERPYFTMKLIKGRTLSALLQQRKDPTQDRGRMLSIFTSVCHTVAYAHSKGVLHRDLKPANIMVGAFGEVMVVDWGLAKVLNRGGIADEERARQDKSLVTVIETVRTGPGSSGSESLVGAVMGTPAYMPPEQAQGEIEKLDERTDVFALGAILCEILTGVAPYEEIEGEHTVVQAANARLDPARARIEACQADEALKVLCLECLRPAQSTRPRDADEVARAITDYRASVEERAHQAELAAATARIKAHEERRARKLTLALASVVIAAIVLAGGGYYVVEKRQEEQLAQRREAVEEAHGDGLRLARAGQLDKAVEAARRALALAQMGSADEALVERAARFLREAEAGLALEERERLLTAQDETLRARLEALRLDLMGTFGGGVRQAELEAAFGQAFREYGVDLEAADITPALERIRERDVAEEVALALDDWGRLRRLIFGPEAEKTRNLAFLAMDIDLDPQRRKLREAILASDWPTLLQLADPATVHTLTPGSVWVLGATLWNQFDRHVEVYRMYDQAVQLYPGDFILQSTAGLLYRIAGRQQAALACWRAALARRPGDTDARRRMADALFFDGQMGEAAPVYRASIILDPDNARAHYGLGTVLLQLGDYASAAKSFERARDLDPVMDVEPDLRSARFYLGQVTQDEVIAELERATGIGHIVAYAYALVAHPDPQQRAPEVAIQALEEHSAIEAEYDRYWVVDAVAHVEMGDFEGALAIVQGRFGIPDFIVLTPGALEFVRAVIYDGLDNDEAARECYARGMTEWDRITTSDPEAWANSDVMRWRRRAEAALGG